jgi:5-methylcytosine-specific restriction endonuclease McrA
MRLLKEIPEVEIKIQSGDLNLTQVTMARTYFREVKATVQEKKEILSAIENQSARATERILVESKPESFAPLAISEKERFLRGQKLEVTFILDEETQKNLEEIEVLLNRKYSKLELFKMMTQRTLHQLKKKQSVVKEQMKSETRNDFTDRKLSTGDQSAHSLERKAQPSVKAQSKKSRYISAKIRKAVAQRDQNRCQFVDPVSRRQCECRVHLEFDHIKAFAQGGENSYENLQLLCSTHNKLRALQTYGNNKMRIYQSSLR